MSDLAYLGAAEAMARFRDRSLSPVELTEAVIARAEETEPTVNALTYRYFDDARRAARAAEARFAGDGPKPRALEGLCVAVKDSSDIAGRPTSAGSLTRGDAPAAATSPINQRVLAAGAIVHARSATPEFSCSTATHSIRWGVTRNPWSPDWSPGGSSGGAGAALAAGSATLATGSDIGGSIRIPASCCGVVGYKPPKGRTPVDPPFNLDPYCHTGPMARSVADTLLFQNVLSGPHRGDPTTLRPKLVLRPGPADLRGWRVAYSADLGFFEIDAEVRAHFETALDVFRDLGAAVEEASPPWNLDVIEAARTHLAQVFGASIAPLLATDAERLTPYAADFARRHAALEPGAFFDALTVAGRMGVEFADLMEGRRLFLCPTTATPGVPATHDPSRDAVSINGAAVDPLLGWALAVPFNMISSHPVLSAPMGVAASGVPTGLQIVGRSYADNDVFRAGLAYEAAHAHAPFTPGRRPSFGPAPAPS